MIRFDVLTQNSHPFFQVLNSIFGFQDDAINGHDTIGWEIRNQATHVSLLISVCLLTNIYTLVNKSTFNFICV